MFKVIKVIKLQLQRQQAGAVRPPNAWLNFSLKFKGGHNVHYTDPGVSNPCKGNLYMLAITDSTLAAHPTFVMRTRVSYTG